MNGGGPVALVAAGRELLARGLVVGTAGNLSVRSGPDHIAITPSAVAYADMEPSDIVWVALADAGPAAPVGPPTTRPTAGARPSSELALHVACYLADACTGAVVHSHPVWASMFAVARLPIPCCMDEMEAGVGGDIRCARYAPSGGADLGSVAVEALAGRRAALLANHGLVTVGATLGEAMHTTVLVERAAKIIWGARLLGGAQPLG